MSKEKQKVGLKSEIITKRGKLTVKELQCLFLAGLILFFIFAFGISTSIKSERSMAVKSNGLAYNYRTPTINGASEIEELAEEEAEMLEAGMHVYEGYASAVS